MLRRSRCVLIFSLKTKSALVQVGNSSDRSVTLKPKTIVGTISTVSATTPQNASAAGNNHSESSQARIDLTAALDESFKRCTFNDHRQTHLLELCSKYQPVFHYPRKNWENILLLKQNSPYRNTLSQLIITRIGRTQEHKK